MKINRVFLWADIVWEEKWRVILLAILICVITIANCSAYSQYKKFNYFREIHPYMENAYFSANASKVQNNRYASLSRENILNIKENEVYNVLCFSYGMDLTGYLNQKGDSIQLYSFPVDFSSNRILPVRTIDGRIITELKPNEVLLDDSAKRLYAIGDVITIKAFGIYGTAIEPRFNDDVLYQFKVVGFVSRTDYIVTDAGMRTLNDIYNPVKDLSVYYGDGNHVRGIISYLDNGRFILCDGLLSQTLSGVVFIIKDGYTEKDLRDELISQGYDDSMLISYNSMLERYEHDYADEIRTSKIMLIVSIILSVAVIASAFFSNYICKRRELAIYVLLGNTWNQSVFLSLTPYVLSLVLGTLMGCSYWYYNTQIQAGDMGLSIPSGLFIILFLIYLILFSILGLLYFYVFKKLSPVEQLRDKE